MEVIFWSCVVGAAFYSLLENFRIGEAFGRGEAFISLVEAERIQSIRGGGNQKMQNSLDFIHR
jgi:hypothetical protein